MTEAQAKIITPVWARADLPPRPQIQRKAVNKMTHWQTRFIRDHMITILLIVAMVLEGVIVGTGTAHRVRQETEARLAAEYAAQLDAYKADQAQAEQAAHWLSGDASREAAINQEVDAVARVIAKLSTDAQKVTEAACMLARVMSPAYPNSFREVAEQPQQWMFYDPLADNTFTQHDREIADSIVRPYMESGIVPNGLTADLVYGEWTPGDFILRDSYKTTSTMHTWRYQNG